LHGGNRSLTCQVKGKLVFTQLLFDHLTFRLKSSINWDKEFKDNHAETNDLNFQAYGYGHALGSFITPDG
jgi:hypothetical protein